MEQRSKRLARVLAARNAPPTGLSFRFCGSGRKASLHGSVGVPRITGRRPVLKNVGTLLLLFVAGATISSAQTLTTLANFTTGSGGYNYPGYGGPTPLIQAADGNFYGTTNAGGNSGGIGTVFKITPSGTLTFLYSFGANPELSDGASPQTGLLQGSDGNLYGTTNGLSYTGGTVFKVTTGGTLTTLHVFNVTAGVTDGAAPSGLVQASDGNFYGTTQAFDPLVYNGTIFRFTAGGSFTTIYTFCPQSACGLGPTGNMVQGTDGNLYGTTNSGGTGDEGTVFKISLGGNFTTLYAFSRSDGENPSGGLIQGKDGNFYGTTDSGGANGNGAVFKISPGGTLTVLHSFNATDGSGPNSGVIQASDGNFYGTTADGGANGAGTIFEISSLGAFTLLHSFEVVEGTIPSGLIEGSDGKLYGTTKAGGTENVGTVFSFTPAVSLLPAPTIAPGGVVPFYSTSTTIQPGSFVSIYGMNLADATTNSNGAFPTMLGGTSVTIDGKSAYLVYVSPTQINLEAPDDTFRGSVPVVVTTAAGTGSSTVTLGDFGPSFSVLDGKHVAGIILRPNGTGAYGGGTYDIIGPTGTSLGYATVAAKAGDTVELFGVGFGPTNPPVPAGQPFTGTAIATNTVQLMIGGTPVTPFFAGEGSPGLYQLNVTIPAGLGTGDVPLQAMVGGSQTQPGVVISLQ